MLLHRKLVECGIGETTFPLNLQQFQLNLQGSFEQSEGSPPFFFGPQCQIIALLACFYILLRLYCPFLLSCKATLSFQR